MKKLLAALAIAALTGCAGFGLTVQKQLPSPEAQIIFGANAVAAAATLGSALLKNDKITAANAKSYSAILHTASEHLHVANATLLICRRATMSNSMTVPDPCAPTVANDIALSLAVAADVQKVLASK